MEQGFGCYTEAAFVEGLFVHKLGPGCMTFILQLAFLQHPLRGIRSTVLVHVHCGYGVNRYIICHTIGQVVW